jgi:hypothetical protein
MEGGDASDAGAGDAQAEASADAASVDAHAADAAGVDAHGADASADAADAKAADAEAEADAAVAFVNPHWAVGGPVNAFLHAGHSWYVGGDFTRISQYSASNLMALDPTGAPAGCLSARGFDGGINAIAQSGGSVYVGGEFTHYQGSPANRIAKLDAVTCALDTTFSPELGNGFDDVVLALVVANGSVYVSGYFSDYRGASANHIAKLDLTTGALDTTFSPPGTNGFDNSVLAIAASGTSIYAGGSFTAYRGVSGSASKIAKLDATTGALDTTFSPPGANGFSDTVAAVAAYGSSLYVGGYFTGYRGVAGSATRLAKLDLTSGALDTTFSPRAANGFDDVVLTFAFAGTSVYAGGGFSVYRGATSLNRIAKLDLTSGAADTTFSPPGANGFNIQVETLAVSGTSIYVGGPFYRYRDMTTAYSLAKLDLTSGAIDATFAPADGNTNGVAGGERRHVDQRRDGGGNEPLDRRALHRLRRVCDQLPRQAR